MDVGFSLSPAAPIGAFIQHHFKVLNFWEYFPTLLYILSIDDGQSQCYSILIKRKDAEE